MIYRIIYAKLRSASMYIIKKAIGKGIIIVSESVPVPPVHGREPLGPSAAAAAPSPHPPPLCRAARGVYGRVLRRYILRNQGC